MSRTSEIAKTAALAVTATALMIFPAAAQQMTREQYQAVCDRMEVSSQKIRCRAEQLMVEANAHQARIDAANKEGACADTIKSEIAGGRIKHEALKAALAGRPAREVGACNLLNMLTRS